ncbi:terminase endonuclease subunit [Cupriavidus oxalaticus]|uniref:Bacteriophage P2 DNA packaging protein, Terminase, endonuclease subunit n=1 Tax=Cupriavidus oxalaticus TaxID=96344 RepID=A0A976G9X3_9BURK|nr:terminase endonuclease subunit [Cupriavidus oxalaticus]QRQ88519.1 terminase endonuclease subunit [Cupriavidus oxalaticus]QRQ93155.1 terminase endonuclease subunit [Cupriavidus oxalaticus]WQD81765.1 terminase endonuclease subunit [Cupriavidus oxalaticus]SPC13135.1 Bacteriophage P2 DNA packaging protein, Terminase, endonuclease subunit [Cupriavidus oxalaticus]
MTSPARNHFLRVSAQRAAASAEAENPLRHASGHELMLAQLAEHKRQLKLIQSIERKAEAKRAMLPAYAAWVQGVLEADAGVQDEVFMSVMVWNIDVGDFAGALPLASYAIRHGLVMPDQYQRTTACLIAEEYSAMTLKAVEAGQPVDVETLGHVGMLVNDQDMPDEVRAKLHKAVGYANAALVDSTPPDRQQDRREFALRNLRRALELHDKVGVKKDIERLEREIKNAAQAGAKEGDGRG